MEHLLFWGISLIVFGLILYSKSLNIKDKYKEYLKSVEEKHTSSITYFTYEGWKVANDTDGEYFGFAFRFFFICCGIYLILLSFWL